MRLVNMIPALLMGVGGVAVPLAFWIAVMVVTAVKIKTDNRVRRLIITGSVLNIVANLLRVPLNSIVPALIFDNYGIDVLQTVSLVGGLVIDAVSAAGIVCLIYAFWLKFNSGTGLSSNGATGDEERLAGKV